MFLEYTSTKGKRYMLRPYQIGALEDSGRETVIYASIGGNGILFRVDRRYDEVKRELRAARGDDAAELQQDVSA